MSIGMEMKMTHNCIYKKGIKILTRVRLGFYEKWVFDSFFHSNCNQSTSLCPCVMGDKGVGYGGFWIPFEGVWKQRGFVVGTAVAGDLSQSFALSLLWKEAGYPLTTMTFFRWLFEFFATTDHLASSLQIGSELAVPLLPMNCFLTIYLIGSLT